MKTDAIRSGIVKGCLYAAVVLVFLAPVLRLLTMSLKTDGGYGIDNYILLLQEKRTIEAIKNTIEIAVISTAISAAAGSFFAFLVAYTNIRNKKLVEMLVLMPFIIPSYIITLAWSGLLSKRGGVNTLLAGIGIGRIDLYTKGGIILVLGICNIPIVYMNVVHMLRRIPADLELAARTCGYSQFEAMIKINLKQVMPAIAGGSILAFLASIDNFSVPAFLGISSGIPVLSTYIYEKTIGFGPSAFPAAAALSVILSGIAVAGTLLEGVSGKWDSGRESIREDYSVRIVLGRWKGLITEGVVTGGLLLVNIVPLLSMITSAFLKTYGMKLAWNNLSLKNFNFVFHNQGVLTAVRNSLLLASLTTIVCVVVGTAVAYQKVRRGSRCVWLVEKSASLTYAIPGIVLALSMIFHWVEPLPGIRPGIYGTIHILIVAYITRYLIFQIKSSTTAMLSVNSSLEEAVFASGRRKAAMWWNILIPLLLKPVLSGAFLIFVPALTELTLSSMLAAAGTKTIGLTIFNFQQSGDYNLAAAMSTVIVVIILSAYGAVCLSGNKSENKKEAAYEPDTKKHHSNLRRCPGIEPN